MTNVKATAAARDRRVVKSASKAKVDVAAVAEQTSDAYSFDRYANWKACAQMLAKHGLDAKQIEAVLRSKWTRWAGDASNARYGHVTSADLERFMDAGKYWAKVAELTRETFAS